MAESSNKDVIYIDIDDEITGIIDKVRSSRHQIVALVLPKRATTLQSIVNIKLLKRTADEAKKHVVLITSEEGLLPLAGSVGMFVARNLQSKPEIPSAPEVPDGDANDAKEAIDLSEGEDDEPKLDSNKPVGELAGAAGIGAAAGAAAARDDDEEIELDNTDNESEKPDSSEDSSKKSKKSKNAKNKKLKVPNFERFRIWMIIGALAIVIFIVLLWLSFTVLPKATITIQTNSQSVNTNEQVTLSSNATSVDTSGSIVPAQASQTQKTYTGTVNTTGQQNNGQTATGSVNMTAQECSPPFSSPSPIPSGTGLSGNGLTFITQQSTTFSNHANFDGKCFDFPANSATSVSAQSAGSKYNLSSADFTVSGATNVTATGTTSGGTDNIVQVVAQADISNAQSKINTDDNAVKNQLESDLESQGLYPIPATFNSSTPNTSNSAAVGAPANQVTVTESITYTMYGAKRTDLQQIIAANVDTQIDTSKQKILDYGLSSAQFSVADQGANSVVVNMQVSSLAGSALNVTQIKQQSAGEKPGTAESTIKSYPGVTNVSVGLSPFFVSSIPKNTNKITVKIENP